ncbi:SGNH/GDSL hydrolase family protein [Sphaerochaeta sp. PS]|uniref:SGNH/GDSL hydrolase family protein n=1 Tax=Sphaerochaeta sp. PS TaxID=3076336 RepID=UPI0028A4B161|nr:SGNH/GDSL hydrolase family protein [Sphaerochaeta sp. PS]MDT4762234.1 SGNH/GDSL hydrolase family protein [Sphaerochaeta sp. PS]
MMQKTFSILGDSISTFAGFNPPENEIFYPKEGYDVVLKEHTWWHLLMEETNLKILMNESYSGSRISETGARPLSSSFLAHKRQERLEGDFIIIFGGTNDFGQADSPTTLPIFAEAYQRLVRSMLALHQRSTLYFCTPLQRTDRTLTAMNANGWNQNDLARTIRQTVASYPKAHLIDLAAYPIKEGDGLLADGLHPTREGMRVVARLMQEWLHQ